MLVYREKQGPIPATKNGASQQTTEIIQHAAARLNTKSRLSAELF